MSLIVMMSFVVDNLLSILALSSIMSKSAEYQAFTDCYKYFKLAVQASPKGVCDQLICHQLLPPAVIDYVSNDTHDRGEKASRICNTVANQMQINPEAVYSFISSLEGAGEWTRHAVNKFKKALENRKQEECIKSKQKITKALIQENCELRE